MHLAEAEVRCPFCGEPNYLELDPSENSQQVFIQDCEVCCRPIEFRLSFDEEGEAESIEVSYAN